MEKYIYAVRKGRRSGIYADWKDYYEQISELSDAESQKFMYQEELEEEDEEFPYSKAWAIRKAEQYIQQTKYVDMSEILHQKLWINDELRMGSPWLDAILSIAGRGTPQISGGRYTGRYFVTSLYCLILFWVFETDKILNEILTFHNKTVKNPTSKAGEKEWYECMHYEIERSDEYINLKSRFEKNGMHALDLNGIYHRNMEFAMNSSILDESLSAQCIRKFLLSGQHNLMELYDELVSNSTYRNELRIVNGDFYNPDLYKEISSSVENRSLDEIIQKTSRLNETLRGSIMGQDAVLEKLEKAYFHNEKSIMGVEKRQGPRSVYLFAGPPGVGKTYTAKLFAESIGIDYRKFDMSGYASAAALDELAGISSFYRASKPGVLTSYVNVHPHSVLVFDEIEKASPEVIRMFLQILEDGTCFDRHYDRNISFKDCMIVMTTNAGRRLYEDTLYDDLTNLPDRVIIDALEKDINPSTKAPYFPQEIISRFSSHTIIMFNRMNSDGLRKIINKNIHDQISSTNGIYNLDISEGSDILENVILFSIGGCGDARNASKIAGKLIDNEIYEVINMAGEYEGKINKIVWMNSFDGVDGEVVRIYNDSDAATYLCKRHLVLKYEMERTISKDGQTAYVKFVRMRFESAIDVEDRDIIIPDKLKPNKTWDEIFVSKEVRKEMEYFINYLSNPLEYSRIKARIPKGAIMFGPPGTGKTSIAKVVATEADANFIAVSADEMSSGGPDKVHNIFRIARKYAPTVLFIDELDATPTASLNALLTEMDGFNNTDTDIVFVMAATNRAEIDKALLRRFDRSFVIDAPDENGREWFLRQLLNKYKEQISISETLIRKIVFRSEGLSMAELENIIETTVRESIRTGKVITDSNMNTIFESYVHEKYGDGKLKLCCEERDIHE